MKASQIIKRPTPKQFILTIFAYVILVTLIGSIVAPPLFVGASLIFFTMMVMSALSFLQPPLPKRFVNFGGEVIWFALIFVLFQEYHMLSMNIPTIKSELHQVSGVMPIEKSELSHGSEALKVDGVYLHCDLAIYDYCSSVLDNETYEQAMVTAYFQPIALFGNLVYEMRVNNDVVYHYDNQLQKFKSLKKEKQIQWMWTFLLYGLPSFWFMMQSRRFAKDLPRMTDEEYAQMKVEQKNRYGIIDYIIGFVVVTMVMSCLMGAAIFIAIQNLILAAVSMAGLAFSMYICHILLIKPTLEEK